MTAALLWVRRDLRSGDHPALHAALAAAGQVHVVFVVDELLWQRAGRVPRGWLAANVLDLRDGLGGRLTVVAGDPVRLVPELAERVGAGSVHVSAETTPYGVRRDAAVARALTATGRELVRTGSPYAVGPGRVLTGGGTPYQVFTPFARAWRAHGWPAPASPAPLEGLAPGASEPAALDALRAAVELAGTLPRPGEQAALLRWQRFLDERLHGYAETRDRPDVAGTSGLSPYLKVGAIHPRTLLADLAGRHEGEDVSRLVDELAWREFYADVLHHRPGSAWHDLRALGIAQDDAADAAEPLAAWRAGRTGFPIVDAGMRQLAATGWMHNRVRMITASFLCKDLHLPWQVGARHFLDLLADADLASNNHGWQWVAGTGTDASPFFRVFHPVTQGLRFDPEGEYVRRWVPELAGLQGRAAHEPWKHGGAPGYPAPILDHASERLEALARYAARR
ncbi:cryptochrome/photolyase family protein [Nocardioides daejeonensis]|uniref:cryptochrome/photolyase family protein n=1 Tax=Nocardioides daejeonensis TaxID=1046556 RepID=UPI000D740DC3|nr:deoxyribodipyrimidine photo-lyase [Nocardioides daejeonensis]